MRHYYWCGDEELLIPAESAEDAGPLYECGSCGNIFSRANSLNLNHQCAECNRFGAKLAEVSCPNDCQSELEEVETIEANGNVYVVPRDEWISQ